MSMTQITLGEMSGGGGAPEIMLGGDARSATTNGVTWDYDANILIMNCINNTYGHTVIVDLSALDETTPTQLTCWALSNNYNSNKWYSATGFGGITAVATKRSFRITNITGGLSVETLIPLNSEYPTSIPT